MHTTVGHMILLALMMIFFISISKLSGDLVRPTDPKRLLGGCPLTAMATKPLSVQANLAKDSIKPLKTQASRLRIHHDRQLHPSFHDCREYTKADGFCVCKSIQEFLVLTCKHKCPLRHVCILSPLDIVFTTSLVHCVWNFRPRHPFYPLLLCPLINVH